MYQNYSTATPSSYQNNNPANKVFAAFSKLALLNPTYNTISKLVTPKLVTHVQIVPSRILVFFWKFCPC